MFVVFFLFGLVYTGPGRCHFAEYGPYSSEEIAREKSRYTQGHLTCHAFEVPEYFYQLVQCAEGDAQLTRMGREEGILPRCK